MISIVHLLWIIWECSSGRNTGCSLLSQMSELVVLVKPNKESTPPLKGEGFRGANEGTLRGGHPGKYPHFNTWTKTMETRGSGGEIWTYKAEKSAEIIAWNRRRELAKSHNNWRCMPHEQHNLRFCFPLNWPVINHKQWICKIIHSYSKQSDRTRKCSTKDSFSRNQSGLKIYWPRSWKYRRGICTHPETDILFLCFVKATIAGVYLTGPI